MSVLSFMCCLDSFVMLVTHNFFMLLGFNMSFLMWLLSFFRMLYNLLLMLDNYLWMLDNYLRAQFLLLVNHCLDTIVHVLYKLGFASP